MLQLLNVSKTFGDRLAVHPLDLSMEAGRTTALLGPSRCGKSTLLRMIIGLISPDRGSVVFDGAEITPENVLEVRRKMGYVIQDGGLFPHLTAEKNVTIVARFLQWSYIYASIRSKIQIKLFGHALGVVVGGLDTEPIPLTASKGGRVGRQGRAAG